MSSNDTTDVKSKACFVCRRVLELCEFYKHPKMGDGHLGKCKECTKRQVRENSAKNREYYREYDRLRYSNPIRRADTAIRAAESARRNPERVASSKDKWANSNTEKRLAHRMVSNRLSNGKPSVCSACGSGGRIHGHHEDYSRPLDVVWLCSKCHGDAHRKKPSEDFVPIGRGGYRGKKKSL